MEAVGGGVQDQKRAGLLRLRTERGAFLYLSSSRSSYLRCCCCCCCWFRVLIRFLSVVGRLHPFVALGCGPFGWLYGSITGVSDGERKKKGPVGKGSTVKLVVFVCVSLLFGYYSIPLPAATFAWINRICFLSIYRSICPIQRSLSYTRKKDEWFLCFRAFAKDR